MKDELERVVDAAPVGEVLFAHLARNIASDLVAKKLETLIATFNGPYTMAIEVRHFTPNVAHGFFIAVQLLSLTCIRVVFTYDVVAMSR